MSERYRLVFRGEVLEGQHPAVVRKRLAEAGRFDVAQLDKLFSGNPVVLKREADGATAARWQSLFRSAGARLRVLPVEAASAVADPAGDTAIDSANAASPATATETTPDWELLPAGSDLLRAEERDVPTPVQVDTGGLSLAPPGPVVTAQRPAPAAPDVSHLSVAEPGARLAQGAGPPPVVVQVPVFEVAAAGVDLSPRRAADPPPPPDVSHIRLADEG